MLFRHRSPPPPSPVMEAAERLQRLSEDLRVAAQMLSSTLDSPLSEHVRRDYLKPPEGK